MRFGAADLTGAVLSLLYGIYLVGIANAASEVSDVRLKSAFGQNYQDKDSGEYDDAA